MWNNYGGGTVPQPQPQAQVCSMVVRVSSEQEGRAFLVQRGLTQLMTNLDDSEFYAYIQKLEKLMEEAPNDHMRQSIQRALDEAQRM